MEAAAYSSVGFWTLMITLTMMSMATSTGTPTKGMNMAREMERLISRVNELAGVWLLFLL